VREPETEREVRGADSKTYTGDRGRRRTEDASDILEELF
jgi:hypothetical protein